MTHYVILAKYIEVDQSGCETLKDMTVLSVEHSKDEAIAKIQEVEKAYKDNDDIVINSETNSINGGIEIIPEQENPSYYINIYMEEVE